MSSISLICGRSSASWSTIKLSMLYKDLTEEQFEEICKHYHKEYPPVPLEGMPDRLDICRPCRKCPFGIQFDDSRWRECRLEGLFWEVPNDIVELIK